MNRKHNLLLLFSTVNVACQVAKQIDFFFFCIPNMSTAAGKKKHFMVPFTLTREELESGPEIFQPLTREELESGPEIFQPWISHG